MRNRKIKDMRTIKQLIESGAPLRAFLEATKAGKSLTYPTDNHSYYDDTGEDIKEIEKYLGAKNSAINTEDIPKNPPADYRKDSMLPRYQEISKFYDYLLSLKMTNKVDIGSMMLGLHFGKVKGVKFVVNEHGYLFSKASDVDKLYKIALTYGGNGKAGASASSSKADTFSLSSWKNDVKEITGGDANWDGYGSSDADISLVNLYNDAQDTLGKKPTQIGVIQWDAPSSSDGKAVAAMMKYANENPKPVKGYKGKSLVTYADSFLNVVVPKADTKKFLAWAK